MGSLDELTANLLRLRLSQVVQAADATIAARDAMEEHTLTHGDLTTHIWKNCPECGALTVRLLETNRAYRDLVDEVAPDIAMVERRASTEDAGRDDG